MIVGGDMGDMIEKCQKVIILKKTSGGGWTFLMHN